jgi:hypothetical protein
MKWAEAMKHSIFGCLLIAALSFSSGSRAAEPISPGSQQLFQIIDRLDVEHRWPAGKHVFWETGVPDGKPEGNIGKHTHCSAFVAAAAKRVGIYVLRPPEHKQLLLANAQYDWLSSGGAAQGWKRISDGVQAQGYANQGWLVLAAYRNHDDYEPGHIAIVRPSDKNLGTLQEEGPQITQAGGTNYRSVALRIGFKGERFREVAYYGHPVDAAALSSAASR